jgi:hypothetical protein
MKFLKGYKKFLESMKIDVSIVNIDMNESLSMFYEDILKSINAEEISSSDRIYKIKSTDSRGIESNIDLSEEQFLKGLEDLSQNPDFIESLKQIGLKKSPLQNTDDFDTFVNKPCRFIFISRIETTELEDPEYIIFQSWNSINSEWDSPKIYKIKGNINDFYDKLSTTKIELELDNKKWTYQTANKNEWNLESGDETDMFRKNLRKDELEKLINDNKIRIIIPDRLGKSN